MLRLRASTGKPELLPVRYLELGESIPIAFLGGLELRPDGIKVGLSTTLLIRAEPRCLVRPEVPTRYSIVAPERDGLRRPIVEKRRQEKSPPQRRLTTMPGSGVRRDGL